MTNAPAPWHFDHNRDEITIYADNDWPIARLLEHNDFHNGWLISAAPTMLAALKNIRDCRNGKHNFEEAWRWVDDAIAAAERTKLPGHGDALAALKKIRDVTGTSTEAWHIANDAITKAEPPLKPDSC